MTDTAYTAYTEALATMKKAEEQADAAIKRLVTTFRPLLGPNSSWKDCYLSGVVDQIPPVLIRLGGAQRQQVNVGNVQSDLLNLHQLMQMYAEAEEAAQAAYGNIPNAQTTLLPPPWSRKASA